MLNLKINQNDFNKVSRGGISHLIVCKETELGPGDLLCLYNDERNCVVKVKYIDCEGSGIDENYCILKVKKI